MNGPLSPVFLTSPTFHSPFPGPERSTSFSLSSYSSPSFPPGPGTSNQAGPSRVNRPQAEPVTRSRTLFYLSIRDSSITPHRGPKRSAAGYGNTLDVGEDEEDGLLPGAGGKGGTIRVDMKGLPPKWVDISDEVEEILGQSGAKISALEKLHAKHALPGFTDRTAEEREIERQTTDITRDFRRCTTLISSIKPSRNATRVETTTAKNVQRGLAQKVQDISQQFRKKQRIYMHKLQGHAIKNKDLLVASGAITLKGADLIDELEDDVEDSKNQLEAQNQTQSQAQLGVGLDIEQRTNEITQIASSISELADLFRDLGNLVVEQGTVLDSVEYNVQQTAKELKGAEEELTVARQYQANTGRRRCILLLVLCIVGLIVVLVYKPRFRSAPDAAPDTVGDDADPYAGIGMGNGIDPVDDTAGLDPDDAAGNMRRVMSRLLRMTLSQ